MKGQISAWSPKQRAARCCPGPEAPREAELLLASRFAFSLDPGALHMASAWLQHSINCGKDRSGPCWVLFPHSLKGAKLGGCCLVPRFPGLRQTWRALQNEAGNLYLLTCHSVTVFIGECLLYFPLFLEGSIFGPQKSRARTCIYLARG